MKQGLCKVLHSFLLWLGNGLLATQDIMLNKFSLLQKIKFSGHGERQFLDKAPIWTRSSKVRNKSEASTAPAS